MSTQLTFDDAPLARRGDPETSHAAAAASAEFRGEHQAKILDALRWYGPMGKTGIAKTSGLDHIAVARRLPELQRKGLASPTGRTVPSTSGRLEREWSVA
jgi:hypothetical protein